MRWLDHCCLYDRAIVGNHRVKATYATAFDFVSGYSHPLQFAVSHIDSSHRISFQTLGHVSIWAHVTLEPNSWFWSLLQAFAG